ncbi:hypothetical protein [Exiguobacterium sp. E4787]|uniref:hypothetical protein n=1 Tax=Exiguobacterium sp. E4787 TaxID=2751225 RepID=UPI001BE6268A|nr:hypothetical protein [Exiguobacterium sp. E4787]
MNYVIFNDGFKDLSRLFFLDVENSDNVKVIRRNNIFKFSFFNFICKAHLSHRMNNRYSLPFKKVWYKKLSNVKFKKEDTICFIITADWYYPEFIEYLKIKYPNSKFVFYFSDTVESKLNKISYMSVTQMKKKFDLILSYNMRDVEKYDLIYTSIPYSFVPKEWKAEFQKYKEVDVLFIGAARNRIEEIEMAYKKLTKAKLKCFFYIVDKNYSSTEVNEGIIYSPHAMPFKEFMGRTMAANCILEILDKGTTGSTLRFWDAIMYNKKLLTNYPYTKKSKFYNPNYIQYFTIPEEIDIEFLKAKNTIDYKYKGENSPETFLNLISSHLQ